MKKADGSSDYEGWCWPGGCAWKSHDLACHVTLSHDPPIGSSSWIDFMDPAKRQWWAEQFAYDKYKVCVCVCVCVCLIDYALIEGFYS